MPKFLFEASYTLDGVKGVQSKGGTSRRDAVASVAESVGGRLESFHFAFGDRDAYVVVDLPDNESATAVALTVNAAGGATVRTVVLLTPEEVDAAAKRSVDYRPPGQLTGTRRRGRSLQSFADAERRLFAYYGLECESRSLGLSDPAASIGVRECGAGDPVLFIHGSGMSGATWAPVIACLTDRRSIAIDLPGFGLSDPYSYSGRPLRAHAVAQLTSSLDALGIERAALVGTSLGGMWALCLALDAPERVSAVVSIGMPAVALPGLRGDPFFTLLTIPGLGRIASRVVPTPKSAKAVRRGMKGVIGQAALDRTPDEFCEVVAAGMGMPGWREAMWTHLNLALRFGRARPENNLTDDELRSIAAPVLFIWGEDERLRRSRDRAPGRGADPAGSTRGHAGQPRALPERPGALCRADHAVDTCLRLRRGTTSVV